MAVREGKIRVTLEKGSVRSSMRGITAEAKAEGSNISKALSGGFSAGMSNVRKSFGNTLNSMMGGLRRIMTFGGILGGGALIKSAIQAEAVYRNIEFTLSKLPGHALKWQGIQKLVEDSADRTGQNTADMSNSFSQVAKDTGDLEYSKAALDAIGTAATASGENLDSLGAAAVIMKEKFGIGVDEVKNGMAVMVNMTGAGGKSLDELNTKFSLMAGEAAAAGMSGVEGMGQVLKILSNLDDAIGEKADPGLKKIFQTLKIGSSTLKNFQKKSGIKFDVDSSALEKIQQILGSKKGRATAELTFTGDARTVWDTLVKPFDDAVKQAKERGLKGEEIAKSGLEAFETSIDVAANSTDAYAKMQKTAADRMKNDPSVILRKTLDKVTRSLAQPKMISAIEKLAQYLPPLADGFASLLAWVIDNPLLAVTTGAALKGGGSFLGGSVPSFLKTLFEGGGKGGGTGAVVKGAGKAAGVGLERFDDAAYKAIGGLGRIEQKSLTAAQALNGFAGGLAALDIGLMIGSAIDKYITGAASKKYDKALEDATAFRAMPETLEGKKKRKMEIFQKSLNLASTFSNPSNAVGEIAGLFGGRSASDINQEANIALAKELLRVTKAINKQEAEKANAEALKQLKSFKDDVYNAGRALRESFPQNTIRGPFPSPGTKPGHEPVRG